MEWKWSLSFNISRSYIPEGTPVVIKRRSVSIEKTRKLAKRLGGVLHEFEGSRSSKKIFVKILFNTKREAVQAQKILQRLFKKERFLRYKMEPMVLRKHQY